MNSAWIGVIGTAIGAVIGVGGALLAQKLSWDKSYHQTHSIELWKARLDLFKRLAVVISELISLFSMRTEFTRGQIPEINLEGWRKEYGSRQDRLADLFAEARFLVGIECNTQLVEFFQAVRTMHVIARDADKSITPKQFWEFATAHTNTLLAVREELLLESIDRETRKRWREIDKGLVRTLGALPRQLENINTTERSSSIHRT